jgi:phosphatidate cytidylyltransferase
MAFNREIFITRTLSAIVFAVVMLAGLFINQWSFLLLFSIIHFGCWWEYWKLMEKIYNTRFHAFTKIGLMVMGYGLLLWFCSPEHFSIKSYSIRGNLPLPVTAAGFVVLLVGIFQKNAVSLRSFSAAFLGIFYISLSWGLMMNMYGIETGNPVLYKDSNGYLIYFPLVIISCMWINDTMAYIVGSLIGKTPFSRISPKKTWEGTIGGVLLASLIVGYIAFIFDEWFVFGQSFKWWAALAAIAAITGTLGDLLESKLKRLAGVKDSGNLMPGHGGFLDRFDSLLLATPFAWLFVKLFLD